MTQANNGLACIVCNPEAFGAVASGDTLSDSRGPSENFDETQGCCTVVGSGHRAIPSFGDMTFERLIEFFDQEQQIYFAGELSLGVTKEAIRKEMLMLLSDDDGAAAIPSDSGNSSGSPPGLVRSEDRFPGFDDSIGNEPLNDLINRVQNEFSVSRVDRAEAVYRYKGWDLIQSVLSQRVAKERVSKRAVKRAGQKSGHKSSARLFHMYSLPVAGESMDADMEGYLSGVVRSENCAFIIRDKKGSAMMFGLLVSDPEGGRVLFLLGSLSIELQAGNVMPFLLRIITDINHSPDISVQLEKIDFYFLFDSEDKELPSSSSW